MDTTTSSTENVGMSDEQIEKIGEILRAAFVSELREHRSEFGVDATQHVFVAKVLISDMCEVFRKHFERFSKLIVRLVRPDRTQTPQQVLDATGRKQYTDANVVANMPRGTGDEVKIIFFAPDKSAYNENGTISDDNLEKQYALYGCSGPADPYSLAKANQDDPAFADKHPNATHWKDTDGKWCYITFRCWWGGGRSVDVDRGDGGWRGYWLFAGLAISPDTSATVN